MHTVFVVVACVAGLALLMALFTHGIRLHWINEPLLALILGMVIGPVGFGWLDLADYGNEMATLEVVALFTLVVALMTVGTELRGSLSGLRQSLTVLVFGGLILTWGISSLLVGWILGLGVLPALLIGAVFAPIDPVLSATVSSGKVARDNLTERMRHLLIAEATSRHGLGLVLVLLPALLITEPDTEAWRNWFADVFLWKFIVAALVGALVGYLAARMQKWSAAQGYAETPTGPLFTILLALPLALAAAVELMDGDGAIAVIVAGVVFALVRIEGKAEGEIEHERLEHEHMLKQILQVPVFVLLGTALPWSEWMDLGWRGVALVVTILLLRRIPVVLLLKPFVGHLHSWKEALFVGWFGPVGVGALYFAAVAHKETHNDQVWVVATLLIAVTVVLHDLTATPLSQWLGRQSSGE